MAHPYEEVDISTFLSYLKSNVWQYFGFPVRINENNVRQVSNDQVICKTCHIPLKYSGSTTNLTFHMKRKDNIDVKNVASSKGLLSAKKEPAGPCGNVDFCSGNVKCS